MRDYVNYFRAIGLQLMKYCSCWIEETKHSACVNLYGEFLVTINNRYSKAVIVDYLFYY